MSNESTTYTSQIGTNGLFGQRSYGWMNRYFRFVVHSNTDIDTYCSGDGVAYMPLVKSANPGLGTITNVGFFANTDGASEFSCHWFRVR